MPLTNQESSSAASPAAAVIPEMLDLPRPECLRLLAAASFGRVAINGSLAPVLRPVNYVFDEPSQSVILRTAHGSKFHALLTSTRATFEIDGTDPTGHTGWSVIVTGVTEEVTNPSQLRYLATVGLDPWAPGFKGHWIRVRATTVSGRRIVIAADPVPGTEREEHPLREAGVPRC
ncbi:MAG: pyridoxamine 5'-phosphate oxidase family protein [Solirubrobacteraceae bacterium]